MIDYVRVIAVYRKRIADRKYEELTYKAKKIDLSKIKYPDTYSYLSDTKNVKNDK